MATFRCPYSRSQEAFLTHEKNRWNGRNLIKINDQVFPRNEINLKFSWVTTRRYNNSTGRLYSSAYKYSNSTVNTTIPRICTWTNYHGINYSSFIYLQWVMFFVEINLISNALENASMTKREAEIIISATLVKFSSTSKFFFFFFIERWTKSRLCMKICCNSFYIFLYFSLARPIFHSFLYNSDEKIQKSMHTHKFVQIYIRARVERAVIASYPVREQRSIMTACFTIV